MTDRAVCIHGHFYQPPRENPWLEEVEAQSSAHPYHDWNERITAECYAPNASSRIVDHEGFVLRMVSNYERMSFNFGPTLLAWMERAAPEVYSRIVDADARGAQRFGGHGPAIAQAYGHVIMPLASPRDVETQVLWGVADFRHRFGRLPEGMWLPETAVDLTSLDAMSRAGILFTILEPHQVSAVRRIGSEHWHDVSGGRVDPTMPYRVSLPEGRSIAVFVYDGPVSQAIAFEGLLADGNRYADRMIGLFGDEDHPQLVNVASDGETYGHHQRHGDMGLAWALERIDQDPDIRLTVYGEWLEQHAPTHEAQIAEMTAWSCVHGVDRWRTDCGCNSGMQGSWHQRWRRPLRDALDWLADEVNTEFSKLAGTVFADPWSARDAYIDVILDRSDEVVGEFLATHLVTPVDQNATVRALQLMELQRHAMLMYTSCGWFFDEVSGIETSQVILYAGRVIQLAEEVLGLDLEQGFTERLSKAESNLAAVGHGGAVYERFVKPARVTLGDVAAHFALTSIFDELPEHSRVKSFDVSVHDRCYAESGTWRLGAGEVTVSSLITRERSQMMYGVLHLGDHNLTGGVRASRSTKRFRQAVDPIFETFQRADLAGTLRRLDKTFGPDTYTLARLFGDERRRIVARIVADTVEETADANRSMYERRVPLLKFLRSIGVPIPDPLATSARIVLNHDLAVVLADPLLDHDAVARMLEDAEVLDIELDRAGLGLELARSVEDALAALTEDPADIGRIDRVASLVDLAQAAPLDVDLTEAQNRLYFLRETVFGPMTARTSGRTRRWESRFRELAAALRVRVD